MKKLLAVLTSLVLCLTVAGCAGADTSSPYGTYIGYALSMPGLGSPEPIESTYDEGENYVELHEDGSAVVCLGGDPIEASYELDGDNLTITMIDSGDSYDSVGTVKDGVLTFDIAGIGFELTFVKEGVEKPFEVVEGGIASGVVGSSDSASESVTMNTSIVDDDTISISVTAKEAYLGDPAYALAITNKTDRAVTVGVEPNSTFTVAGIETNPYLSKDLGAGESAYGVYLWWSASEVADLEGLVDVSGTLIVSDTNSGEELARYAFKV